MDPHKLSPALPKRPSGRRQSRFQSLSKTKSATGEDREFEEEIRRITKLVVDLADQLDLSEKKVEAHLKRIDQNLADLAVQKEQIRVLERGLGLERQR
jgi:hypothetical protein